MTDIAPLSILICAILGFAMLCLAILRMAILERRAGRRTAHVVRPAVSAQPRPALHKSTA